MHIILDKIQYDYSQSDASSLRVPFTKPLKVRGLNQIRLRQSGPKAIATRLNITTLNIMTLSIMTLSITTLSITTLSITSLNIMTLSTMTLSITTLSIITSKTSLSV